MLIPSTVNPNILKVYQINDQVLKKLKCTLISANFKWDESIPKSLQELCIFSIANNWEEKPILKEIIEPINKYLLLDILPVDLPLQLTVPIIDEDIYWKRCFISKWPRKVPFDVADVDSYEIVRANISSKSSIIESNPSRRSSNNDKRKSSLDNVHKRKWKECFLEIYIKEYLERIRPEDYDPEMVKELSDLCGSYIKILTIEELQCSENSCYRIPLNPILMAFQNLKELAICFKQKYVGENFSWNVVKTSENEIKLLGKGLEQCRLSIIRIFNSDIDCNKLEIILKSLKKHDSLRIVDFSHCKIADRGALELAKFYMEIPVKQLILTNNKIGLHGVKNLCYGLSQPNCKLNLLNLRLNEISSEGANFIMHTLAFKDTNLRTLIISSSGITKNPGLEEMIKANKTIQLLDISNNRIGEETGHLILDSLDYNRSIKSIDIRMCNISSESELCIKQKLLKNSKTKKSPQKYMVDESNQTVFDDELKEIEKYFK